MSTVYEAIAAREWGMELVGLSTVTAIEGADAGIDPDEVVADRRTQRREGRAAPGPAGRGGLDER